MRFIILVLSLLSIFSLCAEDVYLFDSAGKAHKEYNSIIEKINTGDKLYVGLDKNDGLAVIKILGEGGTTKIFEVRCNSYPGKRLALRVPLKFQDFSSEYDKIQEFIDITMEGDELIKKYGINSPHIYEYKSKQFILLDFINNEFSLETYFTKPYKIQKDIFEQATKSLKTFLLQTVMFDKIGDFADDQVFYNAQEDKWYLFDWTKSHSIIETFSEKHTVLYGLTLRPNRFTVKMYSILLDLHESIIQKRRELYNQQMCNAFLAF